MDDSVLKPNYVRDLVGMFETVSVAPTYTPKNLIDQIVIYVNGATKRLYVFNTTSATWSYVVMT